MNKNIVALLFALTGCSAWAVSGEETYNAVCANCHAAGVAGSPKVGDAKAWAKLIKEGQVPLTADGYGGVRSMPPKGGRADLSVADFSNAVVYMANKSGANWKEPDAVMLKNINARIDKSKSSKN